MHIPTCRCSQTVFPLTVLRSAGPVWKPAEDKGKTGIRAVCVHVYTHSMAVVSRVSTVHSVAFSWVFLLCPLFVIACQLLWDTALFFPSHFLRSPSVAFPLFTQVSQQSINSSLIGWGLQACWRQRPKRRACQGHPDIAGHEYASKFYQPAQPSKCTLCLLHRSTLLCQEGSITARKPTMDYSY